LASKDNNFIGYWASSMSLENGFENPNADSVSTLIGLLGPSNEYQIQQN